MFWAWLLKYSSFLVTGAVSLAVGYVLKLVTTWRSELISYCSHTQWVSIRPQQGQTQLQPIGTFTLFLWNQGKAPAKDVHVGHYLLPAHNVFPDIPREVLPTPGGGQAIRFSTVPPRTLISISYLYFGAMGVDQIISYVGSEDGPAKRIPVMLQRVFPKWVQSIHITLWVAGIWVAVNFVFSLTKFLWRMYYVR